MTRGDLAAGGRGGCRHGGPRAVAALLLAVLVASCSAPSTSPSAGPAAFLAPPTIPPVVEGASTAQIAGATADPGTPDIAHDQDDVVAGQGDPAYTGDPLHALIHTSPPSTEARPATDSLPPGVVRPSWLGTRPLQLDVDGEALPEPTPEELVVRRVPTIDLLPPPAPDAPFAATVAELDDALVARSTWTPECPVDRTELRYLTVSFWGFDDRPHTGEIIVHHTFADEVIGIFGQLFAARYPIEEMRIVSAAELEGTPTGDGNDTTGFVCRPVRGSTSWSQHAYGLAIDINPFHNPYQRGERILPELAGAYLDRAHERPGMLAEGSTAVAAFDAIGWRWGGRWTSLIDWMHFSANGR